MANTSRAFTPHQYAPIYNTPEEALVCKPTNSLDEVEDAISCIVCRSDGLISLMMCAVEDHLVKEDVILNSLWLLKGQMDQMRLLMEGRSEGRAAA